MFRIITGKEAQTYSDNERLSKRVESLNKEVKNLEEQISDADHKVYRSHVIELRDLIEEYEDSIRSHRNENKAKLETLQAVHDRERETLEEQIAVLKSDIRDYKLASEEDFKDIDLAIEEGINKFRSEAAADLLAADTLLAEANGKIAGHNIALKALDALNETMISLLDSRGSDVTELVKHAGAIAPKVNLEKFNIQVQPTPSNVTVNK